MVQTDVQEKSASEARVAAKPAMHADRGVMHV